MIKHDGTPRRLCGLPGKRLMEKLAMLVIANAVIQAAIRWFVPGRHRNFPPKEGYDASRDAGLVRHERHSPETEGRFGVQVDDEGVVCFLYPSGTIKRRKQNPDGTRDFKPPYGWPRGKPLELFHVNQPTAATTAFIVEGETDAMKLDQLLDGLGGKAPDVYALPGIEAWKEDMG